MNQQTNASEHHSWIAWLALAAAVALASSGLWYARRPPASVPVSPGEQSTPPATAAASQAPLPSPASPPEPKPPRAIPTALAAPDPCFGLQLLDIETAGGAQVRGVWLRNHSAGPALVHPGEKLGAAKLVRVTAGLAGQPANLWFEHATGPCTLGMVPGVDLAGAVGGETPGTRHEREAIERQGTERNLARLGARHGFAMRGAGVNQGGGSPATALDALPAL